MNGVHELLNMLLICIIIVTVIILCGLGYKWGFFYGVIDAQYQELNTQGIIKKMLYVWDDTTSVGVSQYIRIPYFFERLYISLLSAILPDPSWVSFAKFYILNILSFFCTVLVFRSLKHGLIIPKSTPNYVIYLIALLTIFNLSFWSSYKAALLFVKVDYIYFTTALYCINMMVFCKKRHWLALLLLLISSATWPRFPFWLPYLFIIFLYGLYLLSKHHISTKIFLGSCLTYLLAVSPVLLCIFYAQQTLGLGGITTDEYSREVFLLGNSQSTYLNIFSFIGGGTWGYTWPWTNEPFLSFYSSFTEDPIPILLRYIPMISFVFSIFCLRSTIFRNKLIAGLLILFFLLVFGISAYHGILGGLYQYGFENTTVFKLYRESHNKLLPVLVFVISCFILVSLHYLTQRKKITLLVTVGLYSLAFAYTIVAHGGFYDQTGFFKVPDSYHKITNLIDKNSEVLVLPEFNTTKSYDFGHYGVSPFQDILKNPVSLIYTMEDNPFLYTYARKVLDPFNPRVLDTVYARGSNVPSYDTTLLANTKINYIILDGYVDGPGAYDQNDFNSLRKALDASDDFKYLASVGKLIVYERPWTTRRSLFLTPGTVYRKISPTAYTLFLPRLDKTTDLAFLQTYDKGWQIYISPQRSLETNCDVDERFTYLNITRCKATSSRNDTLDAFSKVQLSPKLHGVFDGWANYWRISPSDLHKLPDKYFDLNADGSLRVELEIRYTPQRHFVIAVLIAACTLLFLFSVYAYKVYAKSR